MLSLQEHEDNISINLGDYPKKRISTIYFFNFFTRDRNLYQDNPIRRAKKGDLFVSCPEKTTEGRTRKCIANVNSLEEAVTIAIDFMNKEMENAGRNKTT